MAEVRQVIDWSQLSALAMVLIATVTLGMADKISGETLTAVLGAAVGAATASTQRRAVRGVGGARAGDV